MLDGSERSKEGVVVNLIPPGNTGTRAKNTAGTGSGDGKQLRTTIRLAPIDSPLTQAAAGRDLEM